MTSIIFRGIMKINNAGIAQFGGLLAGDAEAGLRNELLTQQVKLGLSAQPGEYLQARD